MIENWVVDTLNRIQEIAPEAHVAGGYLRDRYHGRLVKDVDIFVRERTDYNYRPETLKQIIKRTHPFSGVEYDAKYFEWDPSVSSVQEFKSEDEGFPSINLITLRLPLFIHENLARFDFGICRIAYDGLNIIYEPEFIKDSDDQTFTLLRCENGAQYAHSMIRWDRLKEKYPNWTLVVPDGIARKYNNKDSFELVFE